jgi:Smr domain
MSEDVFYRNNRQQCLDRIDLHGLSVANAIEKLEQRIQYIEENNMRALTVIVGQGLHSKGGVPKIKPAVLLFAIENGIRYQVNPNNPGSVRLDLKKTKSKKPKKTKKKSKKSKNVRSTPLQLNINLEPKMDIFVADPEPTVPVIDDCPTQQEHITIAISDIATDSDVHPTTHAAAHEKDVRTISPTACRSQKKWIFEVLFYISLAIFLISLLVWLFVPH